MNTNKMTFAALGVFLVLVCAGGLGFCGKPSDHQPKPKPSSSVSKDKKAPVVSSSPKVRR